MPESLLSRDFTNLTAWLEFLPSGVCLIGLRGDLDQAVLEELSDFINENLSEQQTAVIIDMSELDFMDSSGVKFVNRMVRMFGYGNVAVYKISRDCDRILAVLALKNKITHLNRPDELRVWRGETRYAA